MRTARVLLTAFAVLLAVGPGCVCAAGRGEGFDSATPGDGGVAADATPGADGGAGGTDAAPPGCIEDEVCGDGVDNDCDAMIDEDCVCSPPGSVRDCYAGPLATLGVGVCMQGQQTCADPAGGGKFSYWGDCTGDVTPSAEVCNGLDDDCNGAVDDGFADLACGVGACARTTPACAGGAAQSCTPGAPSAEVCNGIDDDCNGLVDDATGTSCELCNGIDDDGDGLVDEDQGFTTCGVGACAATQLNCVGGIVQTCMPGTPTTEICDGNDNDCDGMTDEGLGTLSCGMGGCAVMVPACAAGLPNTCSPGPPSTEVCNGADDDCDGSVDEMLGMSSCGTGACARATANCIGGVPQTCLPGPPAAELCNGIDDDCDGSVDEGGVCGVNMPPMVTCGADITASTLDTVMTSATAVDADGTIVATSWTVTGAPVGSSSAPSPATGYATSFYLDLAGTYTLTFCATDDDGATACCDVVISSVPSEDLRIELFWDAGRATSTADVDLHVINPTATSWFSAMWDCYYANCTFMPLAWPPGGAAGNPSLDVDDVNGYGPENINIDAPDTVTYRVGVHYYDGWGEGAADAVVRVWCWGVMIYETPVQSIANYGANAPTNDFWKVADVTWTGTGPGCTVAVLDTIVTRAAAMTAR
jgi:hypothetical protein